MKIKFNILWLGLSIIVIIVAGCGGDATPTSGADTISLSQENTITLPTGALINVVFDQTGIAGTAIRVKVQLRSPGSLPGATVGTIHWGDNSETRIRDTNDIVVRHVYNLPGNYQFAIQIDGDEKAVGGSISIVPALHIADDGALPVAPPPMPTTGRFAGFTCSPTAGTPIAANATVVIIFPAQFSPPSPSMVLNVTLGGQCESPSTGSGIILPTAAVASRPEIYHCRPGMEHSIVFSVPDGSGTAECSWPVIAGP